MSYCVICQTPAFSSTVYNKQEVCYSCSQTKDPEKFKSLVALISPKVSAENTADYEEVLARNPLASEEMVLRVLDKIVARPPGKGHNILKYSSWYVVTRKNISIEFYKKWLGYDSKLMHLVADRSDLPIDIQKKIADGCIIRSKIELARNPSASADALKKLAQDDLLAVKSAVYFNPSTPDTTRESLKPLIESVKVSVVNPFVLPVHVPGDVVKFVYPFEIEGLPFGRAPFIVSRTGDSHTWYYVPVGYMAKIINPVIRYTTENKIELGYKLNLQNRGKFNNIGYMVPTQYVAAASREEVHAAGLGGWMLTTALSDMERRQPNGYGWVDVYKIPL